VSCALLQACEADGKAQELLASAKALQSDNEERADGLAARERTVHELQQQLAEQQSQLQQQSDEVQAAMQSLQVRTANAPAFCVSCCCGHDVSPTGAVQR
jgi:Ser-tRNA(Ala) deacylase AlaX